eukprot:TRINITY_DN6894_c0_g6_i1.p1 TRINITY_DN6894_c0_g6~~TRINITY_DN6894_c0_g6_i1.p1  ORF type:complete len:998 (+),score=241.90 TRINITY_DN6894_c0_g6_i1:102-3095(+)
MVDRGDEDLMEDLQGEDMSQSCPTDLSLRGLGRRSEASDSRRIPNGRNQQQTLSNAYPAEYFSSLGASAAMMLCLVVDRELLTDGLRSVPFFEVLFLEDFSDEELSQLQWDAEVNLIVIVALQTPTLKHTVARRCCEAVSTNESSPAALLVLVPPPGGREVWQPSNPIDCGHDILEAQAEFLHGGADDVILLAPGQPINPHQAYLITYRTAIIARRSKHLFDHMVKRFERKQKMVLNLAVRRFVWSMPGNSLPTIPPVDSALYEWMEVPNRDDDAGANGGNGGGGGGAGGDGGDRGRGAVGGVGPYVFTQLLGKGGFGCVFKARHPEQGTVAIKCIDKRSVKDANGLFSLDREFCTIRNLPKHKNVCHATAIFHGEQGLYVVMEYAGKLSLQDFTVLMKRDGYKSLPDHLVTSFVSQEAAAVTHVHEAKVCHRDLKPKNFVVSDEEIPTLQLTDFGLAAIITGTEMAKEACGSLPFCAPEVLRNNFMYSPYNGMAADVWSLGVNFLELLHGAWSIETFLNWVPSAPSGSENKVRDIERLETTIQKIPKKGPPAFSVMIENMLKVWPEGRWNMAQVVGPEGLNLLGDQWAGRAVAPPKGGAPNGAKGRSYKNFTNGPHSARNSKPKLTSSKSFSSVLSPLAIQLGDIRLDVDESGKIPRHAVKKALMDMGRTEAQADTEMSQFFEQLEEGGDFERREDFAGGGAESCSLRPIWPASGIGTLALACSEAFSSYSSLDEAILRDVFNQIDADRNGALDKEELADALNRMGKSQRWISSFLAKMTEDALDFQDFCALVRYKCEGLGDECGPAIPVLTLCWWRDDEEEMKAQFNELGSSRRGTLSTQDVTSALQALGKSQDEIDLVLVQLPPDELDFESFKMLANPRRQDASGLSRLSMALSKAFGYGHGLLAAMPEGELKEVFDSINLDKRGLLQRNEVEASLETLGKAQSVVDQLVAPLGDDFALSFEEFKTLVQAKGWYRPPPRFMQDVHAKAEEASTT